MSDDDKTSKTEQPTAKRLNDAFDEGNFPRAPELSVVFVLIASFAMFSFQGPHMAQQVATFSRYIWSHIGQFDLTVDSVSQFLPELFVTSIAFVAPFILVCMVAAILAGGLQTGFRLTPKVLDFKLDRLNPVNGLKSLFNGQKIVSFGVELAKFSIVAWIIWGVLKDIQKDPIFYAPVPPEHVLLFIYHTFMAMLTKLIMALGTVAALNFIYKKWQHNEDLKMTKQEVQDEFKNTEGDPKIKGQRRRFAMQMVYRQILTKVPLADVVVTNPTHYAVALKYERGIDNAPQVLAKGKELYAQRIKQIAAKHGVPMVENVPVARALYKHAKVGSAIPSAMFQAVAQILAYVYRTHRYYFHRLKARRLEAKV